MSTPPGWYPDPDGRPLAIRYWNGAQWTQDLRVHPRDAGDSARRRERRTAFLVAGWTLIAIGALFVLLPIDGYSLWDFLLRTIWVVPSMTALLMAVVGLFGGTGLVVYASRLSKT